MASLYGVFHHLAARGKTTQSVPARGAREVSAASG
jgi:hypothetical protein